MRRVNNIYLVILLIGVLLTSACGKSLGQQITKQLELGQKYLAELNYDEAIVAFQKVIDLEPKTWAAYAGISEAYEAQDNYEKTISILESGMQQISIEEIPSTDVDRLVGFYKICAEQESKQGDQDKLWEYYDKILALRPDDAWAKEKLEEKEKAEQARKREEEVNSALLKFVEPLVEVMQTAAQEQTYDFNAGPIEDREFRSLVNELKAPAIFPLEDGRYLYIERGMNIYYGQMKDGIREGDGMWHYETYTSNGGETNRDEDYFVIVVASWKNNLPNGSAEMYSIYNPESINQEDGMMHLLRLSRVLNLVDGVYDGRSEETEEYDNGSIFYYNNVYEDGFLTESTMRGMAVDLEGNTYQMPEVTTTHNPGETSRRVIWGLGIQ